MRKVLALSIALSLVIGYSLPVYAQSIMPYVRGRILLQVEKNGEAWYINPVDDRRYYLKDGATAYVIMRLLSLGITNADLDKIPVGADPRVYDIQGYSGITDYDNDGLPDRLEWGLGTSATDPDTNSNGYNDGTDLRNGYDPRPPINGAVLGQKMVFDYKLVDRLKGRLLLQVEGQGSVWYVNPADGKRYFLPDGPGAYSAMRYLGLGITNANLDRIESSVMNSYNGGEVTFLYDKLSIINDASLMETSGGLQNFGMSNDTFVVAGLLPSGSQPRTNFKRAYFAVWASDTNVFTECTTITIPNGRTMTLTEQEKLNLYVTALKTSYSGIAAGTTTDYTVYRIAVAGRCYQMVTAVTWDASVQNLDPSSGVKAYDQKVVRTELQWALYSFVYHIDKKGTVVLALTLEQKTAQERCIMLGGSSRLAFSELYGAEQIFCSFGSLGECTQNELNKNACLMK